MAPVTVTRATLRRWGSSLAAVIPPEVIRQEHLAPGDEVTLDVRKALTLRDLFGSLKGAKINAQRIKDEIRREERE